MNENEKTLYQNLQDAGKAVGGKFIVADNHNEKGRSQIKNLTSHIKNYKKLIFYTQSRRKKIIKLSVQIKIKPKNVSTNITEIKRITRKTFFYQQIK